MRRFILIKYREQSWGRVRTRKRQQCLDCKGWFDAGTEMYRPINHGQERMNRICLKCAEWLVRVMGCDHLEDPESV